jgi:prevent-host-death family protein
MQVATVSEFRNRAKNYFDQVEKGETVQIYRNGKPVAVLSPFAFQGRLNTPDPVAARAYWKKVALEPGLKIPGLLKALLEERKRARF